MSGTEYVAVVNDELVRVGDRVGELTVTEIGADYVEFDSKGSGKFIKRLGVKVKKAEVPMRQVASSKQSSELMGEEKIKQAFQYTTDAEIILSGGVKSVAKYKKAISFYDKAERQLQYALDKNLDSDQRTKIKSVISALRDDKASLYSEKRSFEKQIKEAIRNREILYGMTRSDVTRSLGRADEVEKGKYSNNAQEQWIYGDPARKSKYLRFENGILTSFQFYQ